jgi:hypothetical protein
MEYVAGATLRSMLAGPLIVTADENTDLVRY